MSAGAASPAKLMPGTRVRAGNTLTGYKSSDGINWTFVASDTVTMAPNVYVGIAVTSHVNTKLIAATVNNVSVTTP